MDSGVTNVLTTIEELKERIKALEERLEVNWESLSPSHSGGFELPSNDQEVKMLALDLKNRRLEITDLKNLHMLDLLLHLFSVWPVLSQATRHYAYNMARLFNVASTEGWNLAAEQSNGFSPQLVASLSNGHQMPGPVVRSSATSVRNGIEAIQNIREETGIPTAVASTSTPSMTGDNDAQGTQKNQVKTPTAVASTSTGSMQVDIQVAENSMASPSRVKAQLSSSTPPKREAADYAIGASPTKLANVNLSTSTPQTCTQSPLSYKPRCHCKKPANKLQVRKESPNKGRWFYKCFKTEATMTPVNPCSYFKFEDELPEKYEKACSNCGRTGHNKTNCYHPRVK